MTTLKQDLATLLAVQKIDLERDRVEKSRRSLDTGVKAQAELASAQTAAEQARAAASRTSGDLKDAELELASVEKKSSDYMGRMQRGTITSPRELANIEKEVNMLTRQRAALDDKVLSLMDGVEVTRAAMDTAEAVLRQKEQDVKTRQELFHQQHHHLDDQMGGLNRRRAELSGQILDPTLMKRYEALRGKPGNAGIGIAQVDGNTCGGCHMQIGSQASAQAERGEQVTTCENCSRIIV
jgi:predicted  nucleic acid-binding Zn-ribbon protein